MTVRVPAELVERDPAVLAPAASLVHIPDDEPGWSRQGRGSGFEYVDAFGSAVSTDDRERIEAIAIPPAWTSVWICPRADGYLQASGVDDAGRKQYRYHESFRDFCDRRKFERLRYFGRAVVVLRKAAEEGLDQSVGSQEHAIAAAITLIDRCLLRVGNHQSAANGHYGATTLTLEHVVDDGFLNLEYTAKSGAIRTVTVEDDDLADVLSTLAAEADEELFWFDDAADGSRRRATATDVNRFIAEHAGPAFSAKDFRTWGGSCVALRARVEGNGLIDAIDEAADVLGNTRAVARNSYVHPDILALDADELTAMWDRSRSSKWLERSESALRKLLDVAAGS